MVALVDSDEIFIKGMQTLFEEKNIPLNKVITDYKLADKDVANMTVLIGDPYKTSSFSALNIKHAMELNPNLRVLVITSIANKANVNDVIDLGVQAVLFKCCKMDEFISAYFKAIKGECHYCSSIQEKAPFFDTQKLSQLSDREAEIAELIYQGNTTAEIAEILSRSVHTINSHRKSILKKLKIKTPLELLKLMSEIEV